MARPQQQRGLANVAMVVLVMMLTLLQGLAAAEYGKEQENGKEKEQSYGKEEAEEGGEAEAGCEANQLAAYAYWSAQNTVVCSTGQRLAMNGGGGFGTSYCMNASVVAERSVTGAVVGSAQAQVIAMSADASSHLLVGCTLTFMDLQYHFSLPAWRLQSAAPSWGPIAAVSAQQPFSRSWGVGAIAVLPRASDDPPDVVSWWQIDLCYAPFQPL